MYFSLNEFISLHDCDLTFNINFLKSNRITAKEDPFFFNFF